MVGDPLVYRRPFRCRDLLCDNCIGYVLRKIVLRSSLIDRDIEIDPFAYRVVVLTASGVD